MGSWNYADANSSMTGAMQCSACGNKIESGRYRYRMKSKRGDWGYVTQHEACSTDDVVWAEMDRQIAQNRERQAALSDACVAFKAEWGVDELDDYIIGAAT
jgi:hypothetical protein